MRGALKTTMDTQYHQDDSITMMNLIKRFFKRIFKSLVGLYAPQAIIITYALVQINVFPSVPLWFVPLFAIIVIYIFARYVKW